MEALENARIQVVVEDHGIQAGMEEQAQQIPARSNRLAQLSPTDMEAPPQPSLPAASARPRNTKPPNTTQMHHVVGVRVEAMKRLMKFNVALLSMSFILFTFQMLSTRREANGKCDVPETQFRTVVVLDMLSFGVLCFSSGLAALILHKMRVYRDRGNAKAQRSKTVQLLMWAMTLSSIAGMICLLASMVLSFELAVGKLVCQKSYIRALIVIGCSTGVASSLAYCYTVVDSFYW